MPRDCIYLDNNATTPLLPAVWDAMQRCYRDGFGNPASAHQAGRRARRALEDSREQTAALLGAEPDEVIFTSGATEANNLAIFGLAGDPPGHLLASAVEHPCVSEPLTELAARGFTLDWLDVNSTGVVQVDSLPGLLREDTRLVCVMLANHETGALQPVADCQAVVANQSSPAHFHCDAAQAVGKLRVRFQELGVATLSFSAHKFHGPQGVGGLLVRRGIRLKPLFAGGHQQQGRRPGTEPVSLAVGLATALDVAERERETRLAHVWKLRSSLLTYLRTHAAPVVLNGPETDGVPHTLNLSFPGCRSDALLMNLDLAGVACSTGSACSSGSLLPSPVLQAMAAPPDALHSAMRFSFSALLSEAEVEEAARRIAAVVKRLRGEPEA